MDKAHFTPLIGVGVGPETEKLRNLAHVGDMRAD